MSSHKKILSFLNEAETSKIIDESTKLNLQKFAEKYDHKSVLSFLNIISLCGAIAIILGSILLVSHNWFKITNIVKISGFISSIIGLYILAFFIRNNHQKISQIIYFIIAGLMLVGIGLMAQIFHLNNNNSEYFLLFFILTLPMAIILENRWIATISMIGFYFWVFDYAEMGNINYNVNLIFFLTTIFASMILLAKTSKILQNIFYQLKILGYILLSLMVYLFGLFKSNHGEIKIINSDFLLIIILIFNLICIIFNFKKILTKKIDFFKIILQSDAVILGLLAVPLFSNYHNILYWILWFWGCIIAIYHGEKSKNLALINTGVWLFTIGLITRFFDLIHSMLFTGAMFIIFGISLIAMAIITEKFRKKLINKVFNNHE
jgi:uncharacterized membrane protein